jgi:hypothetical protein
MSEAQKKGYIWKLLQEEKAKNEELEEINQELDETNQQLDQANDELIIKLANMNIEVEQHNQLSEKFKKDIKYLESKNNKLTLTLKAVFELVDDDNENASSSPKEIQLANQVKKLKKALKHMTGL